MKWTYTYLKDESGVPLTEEISEDSYLRRAKKIKDLLFILREFSEENKKILEGFTGKPRDENPEKTS